MKDKLYTGIGLLIIFFIIGFRVYYYLKIDNVLLDRNVNTNSNIEKVLYTEISNQIGIHEIEGQNFDVKNLNLANRNEILSRYEIVEYLNAYKKQAESIKNITLVLNNGQYFSTDSSKDVFKGINSEEWFLKTKKKNSLCLIGRKNQDGSYQAMLCSPIIVKDEFLGVLAFEIDKDVFKNLIDKYLNTAKQVYLKDEYGNIMYVHVNNYKSKKNDEIRETYFDDFDVNITNNKTRFVLETCYKYHEALLGINIIKAIFGVIMIIILLHGILRLYKDFREIKIARLALAMTFTLFVEWFFAINYVVARYDKSVDLHAEKMEAFIEDTKEDVTYITSRLGRGFKQNIEEVYNQTHNINDSISKFENEYGTLIETSKNLGEIDLVNAFIITNDGLYNSIPSTKSNDVVLFDFECNRKLISDGKIDDLILYKNTGKNILHTQICKLKDKNGNVFGTFGINFVIEYASRYACELFDNGQPMNMYKVLNDGSIYSDYYDEKYENIEGKIYKDKFLYKFTKDKTEKIKNNMTGMVKEMPKLNAIRYLFFTEYDGVTKTMCEIDIEKKEKTSGETYASFAIMVASLIVLFLFLQIFAIDSNSNFDSDKEIKNDIKQKYYNSNANYVEKEIMDRMRIFGKDENVNVKTNLFDIKDEEILKKEKDSMWTKIKKYIKFKY